MNPIATDAYRRLLALKYLISYAYRSIPARHILEGASHWTAAEISLHEQELKNERSSIIASMKAFEIWDYASTFEKGFISTLASQIDERSQLKAIWRMEAAIMLMWALNLIDTFPGIDEQTDPDYLKLAEIKKTESFSNEFILRPSDEISKMRATMELWHWRVNTRRLIEDNYDFTAHENMIQNGITSLDDIVKTTAKSAHSNGDIKELIDNDFVFRGTAFRNLNANEFNEATSIIIERHYALNWLCGYAPNNNWDDTPTDT